jgi:altronate dehydratase
MIDLIGHRHNDLSDAIPIGHKLALIDIPEGSTVIKYQEAGANRPATWHRART